MEWTKDFSNLLFLDIETVSCCESYDLLEERLKVQWEKKAFRLNFDTPKEALFLEKAGIYAEFGKIIVIGIGLFYKNEIGNLNFRVKSFSGINEKELLEAFIGLVHKFPSDKLYLCAHNGKEFDFPYLCRRMLVNGLKIPNALNLRGKKPWEVKHFDTLEYWKFGDRKNYTSLELLAALFDIPGSKDEMDGSMVSEVFYKEKNIEKIAAYCCRDVVVTAQLFLKLHQMPLLQIENIEFSDVRK